MHLVPISNQVPTTYLEDKVSRSIPRSGVNMSRQRLIMIRRHVESIVVGKHLRRISMNILTIRVRVSA